MSYPTAPLPNHLVQLQSADGARIAVSLFGGQLCSWQTPEGIERLFVSSHAHWDSQQAIRGGVPIIFPQFGADGTGPRHGFARTLPWTLLTSFIEKGDDNSEAVIRLGLSDSVASRRFSAAEFSLALELRFSGQNLCMSLDIDNTGATPFPFNAALHTYLRTDVTTASIHGMQHMTYRDATDADANKIDSQPVIVIDREIDRLYQQAATPLTLRSDVGIIALSQSGFTDTVVWNPWIEKTRTLVDCAPSDYLEFVCIEAALAHRAQLLEPGQRWSGSQQLCVTDECIIN